ncbi:MAG: hypothetical protein IJ720_05385 [Clostridia bacterium]|nr:hypothetical protein [Clostridia bacterium]
MISKNYHPDHYPEGNWVVPENPKVTYLNYKDVSIPNKVLFFMMQVGSRSKDTINVFKTLGHLRNIMPLYTLFFGGIYRMKGRIDHMEKEKIITHAAWRLGCIYEFSHHNPFLRKKYSQEEIFSWAQEDCDSWDDKTRVLFKAVDSIVEKHILEGKEWDDLKKYYNDDQMVEFLMLVGHYIMIAVTVNSTGTQLEEDKWL